MDKIWKAAAAALDGELLTDQHLRCLHDGVEVEAEWIAGVDADADDPASAESMARIWAASSGAEGLEIEFSKNARRSNRPYMTPLWVNGLVREQLQRTPSFDFSLTGGVARGVSETVQSADNLVQAVRSVAMLARGSEYLIERWQTFARDYSGELSIEGELSREGEQLKVALQHDGMPMALQLARLGEYYFTSATAWPQTAPRMELAICRKPDKFKAGLRRGDTRQLGEYHCWTKASEAIHRLEPFIHRLRALSLSSLVIDGEAIRARWLGVETSPARISQAIGYIGELARQGRIGPYR